VRASSEAFNTALGDRSSAARRGSPPSREAAGTAEQTRRPATKARRGRPKPAGASCESTLSRALPPPCAASEPKPMSGGPGGRRADRRRARRPVGLIGVGERAGRGGPKHSRPYAPRAGALRAPALPALQKGDAELMRHGFLQGRLRSAGGRARWPGGPTVVVWIVDGAGRTYGRYRGAARGSILREKQPVHAGPGRGPERPSAFAVRVSATDRGLR